MIKISKDAMQYLVSKCVPFGENGISKTTSRHSKKTYYMCTCKRNVDLLNDYKRSIGMHVEEKKKNKRNKRG